MKKWIWIYSHDQASHFDTKKELMERIQSTVLGFEPDSDWSHDIVIEIDGKKVRTFSIKVRPPKGILEEINNGR
ncbi:hypothetical protein LCGC14_3129950 [marine sediment metagenome]|uniref:Uncharacterized protein n=1 Tax=marine sediment metagenome TaxID=412755 RepID=A0A0F8WNV2_9ZZZZ